MLAKFRACGAAYLAIFLLENRYNRGNFQKMRRRRDILNFKGTMVRPMGTPLQDGIVGQISRLRRSIGWSSFDMLRLTGTDTVLKSAKLA